MSSFTALDKQGIHGHGLMMALENTPKSDDRRTAPAALRNTLPLIEALRERLPSHGCVLEIASGTGQHAAAFAKAFPGLDWIPSDVDPAQRNSIAAWRQECGLSNLAKPLAIDIATQWPVEPGQVQAVLTINLLHLVPDPFVAQLFEEGRKALGNGGRMLIYGPFLRGLSYASQGDQAFDTALRASGMSIGYKSVETVSAKAYKAGFTLIATDQMPANNLLFTFELSSIQT